MSRRVLASIFSLALLIACHEPTSVTPGEEPQPGSGNDRLIMSPASPLVLIGVAGADVGTLPTVRVYGTVSAKPAVGVTVSFTLTSPGGETSKTSVKTSANGNATLPSWRLGSQIGRYVATAQIDNGQAITFNAFVRGQPVAIYDLISMDDQPLPTQNTTQAHYVLFADGSYNHVYNIPVDVNTKFTTVSGTYTRDPAGTILFYVDPRLASTSLTLNNYLFATGYRSGANIRVEYTDFLDWSSELYAPR